MAKFVSRNSKQNPLTTLWNTFSSLDVFTRMFLVIAVLVVAITPFFVNNYQTIFQEAKGPSKTTGSCSVTPNPNTVGSLYTVSGSNLPLNIFVDVFINDGQATTVMMSSTGSTGTVSVSAYSYRTGTSSVSIVDISKNHHTTLATCSFLVQ